jgi:hypothetical protein
MTYPEKQKRKATMIKSYKPEVIADSSGKWTSNGLRFATREEAEQNVVDLMMRWYAVRETRVVESDEPVNYTYHDRQLRAVEGITVTATRSNEVHPDQQEMPLDEK